jgi:hypothetical protein
VTFQVIPPQSQPVEEQSLATMDRVWYRFLHSLFSNGLTFIPIPSHDNSPGSAGQVAYDSDFFYVCVDANVWKRAPLSGGF